MATGDPLLAGKAGDGSYLTDVAAATAVKLRTARSISLTGDVTGSTTFDGSANAAIACTLPNTGVSAGTYTCVVSVTVDAKGRVTAITTA